MTNRSIETLLACTYESPVPLPRPFTPHVRRSTDFWDRATDVITVTGLPALFADTLNGIEDRRVIDQILADLFRADIVIRDRDTLDGPTLQVAAGVRRNGRVTTSYYGHPQLTTAQVLDLGEQLADYFTANPPPKQVRRRLGLPAGPEDTGR